MTKNVSPLCHLKWALIRCFTGLSFEFIRGWNNIADLLYTKGPRERIPQLTPDRHHSHHNIDYWIFYLIYQLSYTWRLRVVEPGFFASGRLLTSFYLVLLFSNRTNWRSKESVKTAVYVLIKKINIFLDGVLSINNTEKETTFPGSVWLLHSPWQHSPLTAVMTEASFVVE